MGFNPNTPRLQFFSFSPSQSSFAEVAKILSEFFRDLDVVPTDIIAGLIIVRKQQKMQRELMVNSFNNDINQFLSGVPITFKTKFLDVSQPEVAEEINTLIYYLGRCSLIWHIRLNISWQIR